MKVFANKKLCFHKGLSFLQKLRELMNTKLDIFIN